MGFFFTKQKPRGAPSKPIGAFSGVRAPTPRSAQQNLPTLHRLGCKACPLNTADIITPKMKPDLGPDGGIYFLAEAPGRDEDEVSGRPLTGPSGSLLRECIPEGGEDDCSFDNVVNCFPGDTMITPVGGVTKIFKRWYAGPLIVIKTVGGNTLSGTPNHPALTPSGKTPFKSLKEGSKIFRRSQSNGVTLGDPNVEDVPITFEQAFNSLSETSISQRVIGSSMDFHGDGSSNKINILVPPSKLRNQVQPNTFCNLGKNPFIRTDKVGNLFKINSPATTHAVNVCNSGLPSTLFTNVEACPELFLTGLTDPGEAGFGSSSDTNTLLSKIPSDSVGANAISGSKAFSTFPFKVQIDHVSSVEQVAFAGHVYNLETEDGWYIANGMCVGNCRPPQNRTPVWQEIECCRPRRWKWIEEAKPKLIVGLGAVPLHWMLGSTDLAGMRGRLFAVKVGNHSCWFLPTYHPSFILRTAYDKKKPLNSRLGHCFRMDIDRAFSALPSLAYPSIDSPGDIHSDIHSFDGNATEQFAQLMELLEKAKKTPVKSIDLETKGLRPYSAGAAIMTAAISFGSTNFSFAIDHPKAKWQVIQRGKILAEFEKLLKDDTIKIAHNAPFELEWLIWLFGPEVVNHAAWEDTQMQAHFLDERRGKAHGGDNEGRRAAYQALDFLCKQHFGITYKHLFKLNKKDMSKSDLGETLTYNGVDTKYTLRLFHAQTRLLERQGLSDAYYDALPRQPTVALMQWLGIDVDQKERQRCHDKLKPEIEAAQAEVAGLKVVKAFVADHKEFNPFSDKDAVRIFKDYLKRPEVTIQDESGGTRYSTNKNILDQIDHPLAGLIIKLRNRNKLKSTYVDSLELGKGRAIFPDGKIHTNFNTTFAETGRTSSDEPNMQNFPERNDKWVRKQIVAPPKHVLLAFDYGQLEACTAAMESKDKVLVKALWEDYDIHMEWAQRVAAAYPAIIGGKGQMKDPKVMGKFRSRIKNKFVFPAIFGAHPLSIAGYLGMPEDIIDDQVADFWEQFHGLKSWQDKTMKGYYKNGYVTTYVGRRHRYPLSSNQAINHPIQGLACEIVCDAMVRLSAEAMDTGNWHIHPRLNIHDDLSFIVPDNDADLEVAIDRIYRTMLTPPYKCVNVPLSVKASVGTNWLDMDEIGKFWSHKDLG